MLRVFIGYDKAEIAAYQVASYSIIRNSSVPVAITPLKLDHFPWFTNNDNKASTDFAFSRFLVPYLSGFSGHSIFMDSDVIVRGDIADLYALRDDKYAVQCVKHDYEPVMGKKFLGTEQTKYYSKNWSSVMLFNNEKCNVLTESFVNKASGLSLHQFDWCEPDQIGSLPKAWNHLVDEEYGQFSSPELIHFTRGGPYFKEFEHCAYADMWREYHKESNSVLDQRVIGGSNV